MRSGASAGHLRLPADGELRSFRILVAAATLLLGALGHPIFLGRVYLGPEYGDLARFHLPLRHFYAESLARGDSLLWCPLEFMGFYLHGEGQLGLYHPLNLLQYRLLPLFAAFDLEILRNYVFLIVGTFLFLRRRGLRRDASMVGAVVFAFSSFNVLHFGHVNVVGIAAHLPWCLLAIDVAARSRDRRGLGLGCAGLALLTTSQLMLGQPQITWTALVAGGLYAGLLLLPGLARPGRRAHAASRLIALFAALVVAFLCAGIALLPQWEAATGSYRIAPPEGFWDAAALPLADLAQLVAPYLFPNRVSGTGLPPELGPLLTAEHGLYAGAVAPVLLAWGLWRWRRWGAYAGLWPAAIALALLGSLLALGERGGLYPLQQLLPVVGLFRVPARYVLLLLLGLALAAALAFDDLARFVARGERLPRRPGAAVLALPFATSLVAVILFQSVWDDRLLAAMAGPVLVGLASLLVVAMARGSRWALAILPFFLVAELGIYGLSWVGGLAVVDPAAWAASLRVPVAPELRVYGSRTPLVMRGVRLTGGYLAMPPERRLFGRRQTLDEAAMPEFARALRVASVGWALGKPVPNPLPRARLVSRAIVGHVETDLARLDVERVALVSWPLDLEPGPPGAARIERERPGEIEIETRAPNRQLLVLSEGYHPGWRATADGRACEVVRVYEDLMGCVVERGTRRVRFDFDPPSFRTGQKVTALGLGLLALGVAWALRPGPRAEAPGPPQASP